MQTDDEARSLQSLLGRRGRALHLHAWRADGVPARAGGQAPREASGRSRAARTGPTPGMPKPGRNGSSQEAWPVRVALEGAAGAAEQRVVGAHVHAAYAGGAEGRPALARRWEARGREPYGAHPGHVVTLPVAPAAALRGSNHSSASLQ